MPIIISLFTIIVFGSLFVLFIKILWEDSKPHITQHKESEDWWYSAPHYHICSNGEKFNIPDYILWDDWKKMDKARRVQVCLQIEARLENTKQNKEEVNELI